MAQIKQVAHLNRNLYIEDEIRFNLLSLASEHESARIYTDQKHVVVCQANFKTPIWIWTHDQVTEEELVSLTECLTTQFNWKSFTTLMVKPEISAYMKSVVESILHEKCRIITEMVAYGWSPTELPLEKRGHMEQANLSMVQKVAEFRARDINEMEHLDVSVTDLKKEAAWMVSSGNTYVWLNPDQRIVSIAFVAHRLPNQARINRVYTHPVMRRKGYGCMLMHELASSIYKEGRTAMVYADAAYPPSNGTYHKSGFIEKGKLYELGI